MALLLLESWDGYGGDTTQAARKWTVGTAATNSTHARSGWAFYGGSGLTTGRAITPATTTLIFGCRVYYDGTHQPAQAGVVVGFVSGASYDGFNSVCALNLNTNGTLYVSRTFNGGVTLGTSVAALTALTLNTLVAKFVLGGTGSYVVYLNGVSILSASGVNMGGTTVGGIHLGGDAATNYALDDLWVMDSSGSTLNDLPIEPVVVPCVLPSSDGALTDFSLSTGSSHSALVDEAIANDDTDYISGTAAQRDTFVFDLSTLSGRTRHAAQISACAKATSAGANYLNGLARDSVPTVTSSLPQSVTTSYGYTQHILSDGMFT